MAVAVAVGVAVAVAVRIPVAVAVGDGVWVAVAVEVVALICCTMTTLVVAVHPYETCVTDTWLIWLDSRLIVAWNGPGEPTLMGWAITQPASLHTCT